MNTSIPRSKRAGAAVNASRGQSTRDRVFKAACELFAATGFHGTHLREICKRAGTNVAGICYHFHDKQGLYQAVVMEAGRRLSDYDEDLIVSQHLPPEERILKLVECLLTKFNAEGAWIAKLLARELVSPAFGARNYAVSGLERNFVLLHFALRELHGSDVHSETIRLHTLSLICECIFYSLAGENLEHPLIQLAAPLPNRARLARLITQRSLGSLDVNDAKPEVSQS
jgi:AcrR family transcriptional regulator